MMISIHPFPARMAPELAIGRLDELARNRPGAVVLDPMSGSGTVVRHASEIGLRSYGFDLDPLAVLISRVSSRRNCDEAIAIAGESVIKEARALKIVPDLPWIDGDPDAERFVEYWFASKQRDDLRRLAHILCRSESLQLDSQTIDVLKVALSRIIVTKSQAASLAQDTSHSRPHRVATESTYDVFGGMERSLKQLRNRLRRIEPKLEGTVDRGDARHLVKMDDESVDLVLTSPPYLNALDYMRGHRMSLIWLGHRYSELSKTRSNSIGSERAPDKKLPEELVAEVQSYMGELTTLPSRYRGMIDRYIGDLHSMMLEVARVLRTGATATFIMGDSCLRGVFISNSNGLAAVAEIAGLQEVDRQMRALPSAHRYLPTPQNGSLGKRMRKETILTFRKRTRSVAN